MKGRLGKFGTIFLAVVLALAITGAGFAKWSQTLYIEGQVETGTLTWGFEEGSFFAKDPPTPPPDQHHLTWDWTVPVGFGAPVQQVKNVGYTTGVLEDPKGTHGSYTLYKTLTLTLSNVYPSYYNEISVVVANGGTIPIVFEKVVIDGTEVGIGDLFVNDYMEFLWVNSIGDQLDPCDSREVSFKVHILEEDDYSGLLGAQPGATYTFTIELVGIQWNEYTP